MKESSFWSTLRNGFNAIPKATRPFCHRIENSAGVGQPDVNVSYAGREVWLELKVMKGNQIEVRHSQFAWLRNRIEVNLHNTFFVARHKDAIWVWKGYSIYECTGPGRATDKSMIFVPSPPDRTFHIDSNLGELRDYLFDLLPKSHR